MHLLERKDQLETLNRCCQEARAGTGKLALILGEAGLGKSSLVEQFVFEHRRDVRTLWGACDALTTPRALGPVHEIASQTSLFGASRAEESRDRLFSALLIELTQPQRLSVVVLEDVHWADEATLDFLRFIGRRIHRTSALVLVTCRDEELAPTHPVRLALGELTGRHVTRVRLTPLSTQAVGELARQSAWDPARLRELTGGNPFFVREVLESPGEPVPESVRDALLARVARWSPGMRELAELVSMSPGRTATALVESVLGPGRAAIDEAASGLLYTQGAAIAFRHELARLAVERTVSPERARELHQRLLAALLARGSDLTELLHHATLAYNAAVVLEYAPRAAKEAARLGAHREAAAHLGAALCHSDSLPTETRAELFEQHAQECSLANQTREAIASATRALELWRTEQNISAQSRVLCFLPQEYRNIGDKARADESIAGAIALLEGLPPSRSLAMAYSSRARLANNRGWDKDALDYGERTLALAQGLGDASLESQALSAMGSALLGSANLSGYAPLEQALEIALTHKLEEDAAHTYRLLLFYAVLIHDLPRAEALFHDGVTYCEERGIFLHSVYIRAYYTPAELERGHWAEATRMVAELLQNPERLGVQQRITLLVTLALVRVRRGDSGADELLDEALVLALPTCELNRIGRVTAARAEQAWYRGDLERVAREAALGLEHMGDHVAPWIKGELCCWRWRAQPDVAIPSDIAEPHRLMLSGDWQGAALAWEAKGMPYEQALALVDGPDDAQRECLALLDRLGAGPLAALVRKRMRDQGARGIPRGRNETTRTNPSGLTAKEIEVLALLAQGCSNAQLARRLHRSRKTIEHHVSAILGKLGVHSRADAVEMALARGIVRSERG